MSFQTSALILSWGAILLLALVVSGLVRQLHALSAGSLSAGGPNRGPSVGLRPGAAAPGLDLLAPRSARPLLLLFLSGDCRTCAEVLGEAGRHAWRDDVAVRALYPGSVPAVAAHQPVEVHGEQADLFERYDAIATPFAVLIDRSGRVVHSEPLGSRSALRTLLARLSGPPAAGAGATTVGATAVGNRASTP
jgi:hypothetical protein